MDDKCVWEKDNSDPLYYNTSCDQGFLFYDGTVQDNEFKYCPFCGRIIELKEPDND